MATNPLNINAASADELFKHLAEMSKSAQVVKKRKEEVPRQCFMQETFMTLCYSEKEQKRQTQLVNKWVKKGLIYFGPPGFTVGKRGRGAMPDQDSPHSTSPDDVSTAIPGDVEDDVFLGGGAVGYDLLTPGATAIPPRGGPCHRVIYLFHLCHLYRKLRHNLRAFRLPIDLQGYEGHILWIN